MNICDNIRKLTSILNEIKQYNMCLSDIVAKNPNNIDNNISNFIDLQLLKKNINITFVGD